MGNPRVLVAPDKFRGTATAHQIAAAAAAGARLAGWEADLAPMADGGEGTLEILGGGNRTAVVDGALGRPVEVEWQLHRETALIEAAGIVGLAMVGGPTANDPLDATTVGVGQLIDEAARAGARTIVVAVGGLASTDGGAGAVAAIRQAQVRETELLVACDVRTLFLDAAEEFAGQKGANEDSVRLLTERLAQDASRYQRCLGVDVTHLVGAGAGGGLAGGLAAIGGRLISGFDFVAGRVGLEQRMRNAEFVITGEGRFDHTSLAGKVVGRVLSLAEQLGVEAAVIAGDIQGNTGVVAVSLAEEFGLPSALAQPLEHCMTTTVRILRCARTRAATTCQHD